MGRQLQSQVLSDLFPFIKIPTFVGCPSDAYVVHIPNTFTKNLFQQKPLIFSLLMDTFGNH